MNTYQNLNNIMHCLKVMADEEVCEECELYNLGDVYCRDVARSAIECIKKQIPMKVKQVGSRNHHRNYCPICNNFLGWDNFKNYCDRCGQRLELKDVL